MAGKSKWWQLGRGIREALSESVADGQTIDQTHAKAKELGADISRSSLARHIRALRQKSQEMHTLMLMSKTILVQQQKGKVSAEDSLRVLASLLTAELQQGLIGPDAEFDAKDFAAKCRAVSHLSTVLKNTVNDMTQSGEDIDPEIQEALNYLDKMEHSHDNL